VGLKPLRADRAERRARPFSRTPRGFEARSLSSASRDPVSLSAEPLVGLKQGGPSREVGGNRLSAEPLVGLKLPEFNCLGLVLLIAFSRTPRGFEA